MSGKFYLKFGFWFDTCGVIPSGGKIANLSAYHQSYSLGRPRTIVINQNYSVDIVPPQKKVPTISNHQCNTKNQNIKKLYLKQQNQTEENYRRNKNQIEALFFFKFPILNFHCLGEKKTCLQSQSANIKEEQLRRDLQSLKWSDTALNLIQAR